MTNLYQMPRLLFPCPPGVAYAIYLSGGALLKNSCVGVVRRQTSGWVSCCESSESSPFFLCVYLCSRVGLPMSCAAVENTDCEWWWHLAIFELLFRSSKR